MNPITTLNRDELTEQTTYVAPTSQNESLLAEMWESILDISPIGINDNFFELGGHSLSALKFIESINKKLKSQLSLQDLYQEKTIAQLVRKITIENTTENAIVNLSVGPDRTANIFFLHPVTGTVFCFNDLAKLNQNRWNFYGLQDLAVTTRHFQACWVWLNFIWRKYGKFNRTGPIILLGTHLVTPSLMN